MVRIGIGWMVGFFASPFYTSPKTMLYHINMDCHHQQPLKQKPTTKSDINWNRKKWDKKAFSKSFCFIFVTGIFLWNCSLLVTYFWKCLFLLIVYRERPQLFSEFNSLGMANNFSSAPRFNTPTICCTRIGNLQLFLQVEQNFQETTICHYLEAKELN